MWIFKQTAIADPYRIKRLICRKEANCVPSEKRIEFFVYDINVSV